MIPMTSEQIEILSKLIGKLLFDRVGKKLTEEEIKSILGELSDILVNKDFWKNGLKYIQEMAKGGMEANKGISENAREQMKKL